jgi:hypothetical protein
MGLFAYLPDSLGLALWNLLNALPLFLAINSLPVKPPQVRIAILWFVLLELIFTIQHAQINGLMAALIILYFNALERGRTLLASLFLALSVYIKLFSFIALVLLVLYPHRLRSVAFSVMWFLVLFAFPFLVIPGNQLLSQYVSWFQLLLSDYSASVGLSVFGWLQTWFKLDLPKTLILLFGGIVLCLPLLNRNHYGEDLFRLLSLAAVLIWITIFNHKAEPSTFVVAICGVAIWYFSQRPNALNLVLVSFAFVFTSLSRTDLFPEYLKVHFIYPYAVKAVPCIFIWGRASYELLFHTYKPRCFLDKS